MSSKRKFTGIGKKVGKRHLETTNPSFIWPSVIFLKQLTEGAPSGPLPPQQNQTDIKHKNREGLLVKHGPGTLSGDGYLTIALSKSTTTDWMQHTAVGPSKNCLCMAMNKPQRDQVYIFKVVPIICYLLSPLVSEIFFLQALFNTRQQTHIIANSDFTPAGKYPKEKEYQMNKHFRQKRLKCLGDWEWCFWKCSLQWKKKSLEKIGELLKTLIPQSLKC